MPLPHHLSGPPTSPLLILAPSLGTSTRLWEPHLPSLERDFRVLRFDLPGHGGASGRGNEAGGTGDGGAGSMTVEDIADRVLALVDGLGRHAFHFAGVSLGGAVGACLAIGRRERVASLTMVCSSAHFGPAGPWRERAALVRREGTGPLLATSPGRWFADPEATAATPLGRGLLGDLAGADPAGYAACCDALAAYDVRSELGRIEAPTLVVGGEYDGVTPLAHARELGEGIPGARVETVRAGHLAVEAPGALRALLGAHLSTRAPG